MAVPGSGEIRLGALAFEKIENNYNDGLPGVIDTSYGPFSLRDITQGGDTYGGGETYDVTNGFSPSHPDNDAPFGMREFYSYDHDFVVAACNIAYYEGSNGTFTFPINLGAETGTVRIEYQAYSIPDKFVFTWNGNTYTSGSTSGNYDGYVGSQAQLQSLRNATGNQSLEITTYTTSNYNPSGTNNGQQGGRYFIEFNKNASTGSMIATVTAPISSTAWWFSISCPGQQVIYANNGVTPSVQTNTETNVTSSGFTMNGQTTSKGLTDNYSTTGTISARGFVYKQTSITIPFLIGDTGVTNQLVDTNNTIGSFSNALTGLLDGTNYAYRAYATNTAGTTYGNVESVTTNLPLADAFQIPQQSHQYGLWQSGFAGLTDTTGGSSSSDPITAQTGSVSDQTKGVDYETQRAINGFVVNLSRSGTSNNEFKIYLNGSLIHTMSGTSQTYTRTNGVIAGSIITFTFTEDDGSTRSGSLSMYAT